MLAVIKQEEQGYVARFERRYRHTVEQVWSMLTANERLAEWFPELRVESLREGGALKFDMQDGTYETMDIVAFSSGSVRFDVD